MNIEIDSYGFMLDTEWCYVALNWQLLITATILTIGYKAYKVYKRTRNSAIENDLDCSTGTNNAWDN
jgi:hypothetical protein